MSLLAVWVDIFWVMGLLLVDVIFVMGVWVDCKSRVQWGFVLSIFPDFFSFSLSVCLLVCLSV